MQKYEFFFLLVSCINGVREARIEKLNRTRRTRWVKKKIHKSLLQAVIHIVWWDDFQVLWFYLLPISSCLPSTRLFTSFSQYNTREICNRLTFMKWKKSFLFFWNMISISLGGSSSSCSFSFHLSLYFYLCLSHSHFILIPSIMLCFTTTHHLWSKSSFTTHLTWTTTAALFVVLPCMVNDMTF